MQRAIELMGEFDGFASVAALAGQGRQGDGERAQGDGVIGADDALVTQAEAASEIEAARQGAEVAHGFGGGARETLVVVEAESGQYGVGLLQGGGVDEAEFADQAVLTGAPDAFDAALGLRGVGGDLLDAELVESADKLGGGLFSGQLFGENPVGIVALEDAVTITVEAERDAVGGDHGVQGAEIADGIFGFELKVSGEDLAGGVVLKADESQGRTATFEPVVTTGAGERHHAETRTGRAAGTILPRPVSYTHLTLPTSELV